ncbi:IS3 family transposase [Bradyrhizobium sp. Pha-3]|uniref:IS3 family transposase n=1 Tax=Bradyrhizobium sp. Pha-3 TaxID=208375 RepID=UPI0035D493A3
MSTPDRRGMLDRADQALSIRRQCMLLGIARSRVYRPPQPANDNDLALMQRIDELFTAWPFLGSRRMTAMLKAEGLQVNRKRVQRLMRKMGIAALGEVLMGEDDTGELRPAKRQRTLSHTEGDAIGRQLSESGNSVAPVLMEHAGAPSPFGPVVGSPLVLPAEGYDQDLLWAMEDAGPSSSREPTARHHQALDLESVVRPFNFPQGDQHASAALDPSNVPPSQDSRPNSFIVHNDRYTALFVPAAAMRRSTPLNPPGAAIPLRFRPENVPQPGAQRANRASPALLGRSMEQAAPAVRQG